MIRWLYRYLFKGFGVLMLIGMITFLILAISRLGDRSTPAPAVTPAAGRR